MGRWWDWLLAVDLARCLVPTGHALIGGGVKWNHRLVTGPGPAPLLGALERVSLARYLSERRGSGRFTYYLECKKKRPNVGRSMDTQHLPGLQAAISPRALSFGATTGATVFRAPCGGERRWLSPAAFLESIRRGHRLCGMVNHHRYRAEYRQFSGRSSS